MVKSLSLNAMINCGMDAAIAATLLPQMNQWLATLPAADCWQRFSQQILQPDHPFALHHLLYTTAYADWDASHGPPPAWFPSTAEIQATHLAAMMRSLNLASYADFHAWSAQHRAEFWHHVIQRLNIRLRKPYQQVLDDSEGVELSRWLVGAQLNIVESCFQAPEEAIAIVTQPEEGQITTWTYGQLHALTNQVANSLVAAGFQPGAAIAIDLPMTATAIAIYLGIIKAGCVVVSIADSFAASEIAVRLHLSKAQAIFTQDWIQRGGKHIPLYARVIEANAPVAVVLSAEVEPAVALRSGDVRWQNFLSPVDQFEAVPANPEAYTNILFSSGTTGKPKAIPWTQTTPIKCAMDGHLHHDIHPGDRVAWPTNLGWMMGPWLIYASLINRAAIALYEGDPTSREFGQFVQDAGVTLLGVVPSLVSTWKTTGCLQGLDWSAVKAFSSTGECSNAQDMLFLMSRADYRPVIEYCGGTEIGGGYITGTLVQPAAPATFTTPALGLDLVLCNPAGQPADKGEVFLIPPAIGLSTTLLNADHHQVYFAHTPAIAPGLRRHGDQIERLANGYYRAQGRVDDTMNLNGIKVSSVELEQALNAVDGIQEVAAIAVTPPEGGPSQLVIYVVVLPEVRQVPAELKAKFQAAIRQHLNPFFKVHEVVIVPSLPRTASNKLMRRVLRDRFSETTLVF